MPPLSTFVGRDADAARLRELLDVSRLVTVVGPGGIGKTRLVRELADAAGEAYPGGVLCAELALLGPQDDLALAAAAQLGVSSLDALAVGLGEDPALLVLDNCEHVLAATRRLAAALLERCPALRVVATSREPLGLDGEHVLALGPLGVPAPSDPDEGAASPAVRLFADRARAAGGCVGATAGERAAVAELCRRLDGVPLAIELAAARTRALTATDLLRHLDRRFELLQRRGGDDARHASLRAVLDTSYALLVPEEQAFFRGLGAFAGPFDAALAHAVAGAPGTDALATLDLLARLVDRSLVVAEPRNGVTRYRLLETLRHYADEQARAAGEADALRERFVQAVVAEADRLTVVGASQWTAEVLETVLAMVGNLTAAVDACIAHDAGAARAFRAIVPLWGAVHQGRAGEIGALCDRVLARWPHGEEPWRAEASAVAVTAHLLDGRPERASALAAETLAAPAASPIARLMLERALGLIARHAGDPAGAARRFAAARAIAAAAGMSPFVRELGIFLDSVAPEAELDAIGERLAVAAAEARAARDPLTETWAHLVAAQRLIVAARHTEARAALDAARRAQGNVDYPYGLKVGARLHAVLTTCAEGWPAARALWRTTIDEIAATGDLAELGLTLRAAAALARRAGDHAAARVLREAAPGGAWITVLGDLFDDVPPAPRAPAGPRDTLEALRRARAALVEAPAVDEPAPVDPVARAAGSLQRAGDGWTVRYGGRRAQMRHLKGLDDLAALLARPDQDVHCLELMGATDVGGRGADLDDRARREYRTRVRELQREIDEAQAACDPPRAARAEHELDVLVQQLSAAFGLGGRARQSGAPVERARSAVTWRLRMAVRRIGEVHPDLGRHLANAVRTGTWCSYRPETAVAWTIDLGTAQGRSS